MSCFGGCHWNNYSKNNKQRKDGNKEIKQIQKDKRIYRLTVRCLLLGTEESGKSTVIKQMRILHGNGFSNDEKKQKINDIKENIRDAILIIIRAMSTLSPPIQLANADNQWRVNYIQDVASNPDFGYPPEFYEHTEILWKDKGVQATFERFHEYNLTDSAKYFLDRVAVVKQTDYTPSEQDILRCRVLTSGVLETKFQFDSINYHMIDVCGQQGEKRKWMKCFNEMSAVIFVTACSSYDMVLHEDPSQNRLKESLVLFNSLWHNSWLRMKPFFLFLNKQDLLEEKIKSGKSKLVDYFSDFANYETSHYAVTDQEDEQEVIRAKYFIQNKFLRMCTYGDDDDDDMEICYAHFTCAVDTENIQRTFTHCREIIQPSCPCFGGSLL